MDTEDLLKKAHEHLAGADPNWNHQTRATIGTGYAVLALIATVKELSPKTHTQLNIKITSEETTSREPANVRIYDAENNLVKEIVGSIEQKKGADGGYYNCVTLTEKTD